MNDKEKKPILSSEEVSESVEVGCKHTSPFFPCGSKDDCSEEESEEEEDKLPFRPNYKIKTKITKKIYGYH